MKTITSLKRGIMLAGALAFSAIPGHADNFGTTSNEFTIEFVIIGNPGNLDDVTNPYPNPGDGGTPFGGVSYHYRMGIYEISQAQIEKATAGGLLNVAAGAWSGNHPAANLTWFEAAAFVNWLNTSTGHHAAYDLTWTGSAWALNLWSKAEAWKVDGENLYRHKSAYYFLPNENEWYKAAFHKNDGVTANYWDYPTGANTIPDGIDFNGDTAFDAVFEQGFNQGFPNDVTNVGVVSPYGTFGQGGNVWEWMESAEDGVNDSPTETRMDRGGRWGLPENELRSSKRGGTSPADSGNNLGFRVASIAPDADADGIPDAYETGTGIYVSPSDTGTSSTNPDSDSDGLQDGAEVFTHHTNPLASDTDGDGFLDGYEVLTGHSPLGRLDKPALVAEALTAIEFTFPAALGKSYRIEDSPDLKTWSTVENGIAGTGGQIQRFYSTRNATKRYFRVEEETP